MPEVVLSESALQELKEIGLVHMQLVSANSARKVTDNILKVLSRLEDFPLSGHLPRDRYLYKEGYRYVVAGKYICIYKLISDTVYVYHIAKESRTP